MLVEGKVHFYARMKSLGSGGDVEPSVKSSMRFLNSRFSQYFVSGRQRLAPPS